jgi:TolA-binding protein
MLREAEAAVKRKQNDVARNYCNQIIALAPESPSARSAKQMLSRLDIPR